MTNRLVHLNAVSQAAHIFAFSLYHLAKLESNSNCSKAVNKMAILKVKNDQQQIMHAGNSDTPSGIICVIRCELMSVNGRHVK
jgi:hypothetical protein